MILTIERVVGGWLLDSDDTRWVVLADIEMLYEVIETYGLGGSRHDARRLRVCYEPGDKHHDDHPDPCADCACACDPPVVQAGVADPVRSIDQ